MEAWLSLGNGDSERGVTMAEKGIAIAQHYEEEEELPRLLEIAGLCWLYLDHHKRDGIFRAKPHAGAKV
jgi:hypothetical protein